MVKRPVALLVSGVLISLLLVVGACLPPAALEPALTTSPGQSVGTTPINPAWTPPQEIQQPALPNISKVVARVKPSVVAINVEVVTYDILNQPTILEGAGSGWVIDKEGYIVTNNHVVEGADNVAVTLSDGSKYYAEKIRTDPFTDLAVLKIDARNLPSLVIGDSSRLEVGEWVVAVGNALGLGISATSGIVSALDVSVPVATGRTLHGLIQTNAAINPGNSGGPLVNMAGEVIGIDSIKIAEVGVEGIGYAISVNKAMPIITGLINVGFIVRPWLGIQFTTTCRMIAGWFDLAVEQGVLVTEVAPGGPAEKAGLKTGDVITAIDGKEVANACELEQLIYMYRVGQKVKVDFWRSQEKNDTSLTLGESPPPEA